MIGLLRPFKAGKSATEPARHRPMLLSGARKLKCRSTQSHRRDLLRTSFKSIQRRPEIFGVTDGTVGSGDPPPIVRGIVCGTAHGFPSRGPKNRTRSRLWLSFFAPFRFYIAGAGSRSPTPAPSRVMGFLPSPLNRRRGAAYFFRALLRYSASRSARILLLAILSVSFMRSMIRRPSR